MRIEPKMMSTAIGSMPFADVEHAVDVSLQTLDAPIWPQLPAFGLREQMEIQYSEGMPRATIDEAKGRMYIDTSGDYSEAFAGFYEAYLTAMDPDSGTGDCSAMAISEEFAHGFHGLLRRLQRSAGKRPWLKAQTTGPASFALTIVDETKRAIWYNEEFRDVVVKTMAMKCRWQLQALKPFAQNLICFIDEPILSAFGSSTYVSVKRDDVVSAIAECVAAVKAEGALAGVHCCGNTEWTILIDAGVDIVNFDAFGFGETIAMYAPAVKRHLDAGGMLAWGVVPTSPAIREQTVASLAAKLEAAMDNLASKGIDKGLIVRQALVTPSCGTGSMEPADAERVFALTAELAGQMKARYGC
jgi:hypothetical protein